MKEILNLLIYLQDTFKILLGFFFALLAFNYQDVYRERKQKRKILIGFYLEIMRNGTDCLLMRESGIIEPFEIEYMNRYEHIEDLKIRKDVFIYSFMIRTINKVIADYITESKIRNNKNEQEIEAYKKSIIESLRSLEDTIKKAKDSFEKELLQLKLLKKRVNP